MGVAISFVKGSGALVHNNREYIHKNVDPDRIKDNINYKNESLEDAYKICFGEAVEKYNQRQTRNDRMIKNYMKQIKDSGNNEKLFYENIVQVGDKYSHGFGSGNEQQSIDILDKYAKDFQERNPNLYVFNMKMHLDEASPHLHIDYIPVATGYKRGLDTRNSLTKAHQNMGIAKSTGRNNNSTMKWQERERRYIKEIAKDHNLEIVNKKIDREHLTVDEYKVYAEEIEKQYDKYMNKKINLKPGKIPFSDKVLLEKKDYEKLADNAKYNYVTEKTVSKYTKKLKGKELELSLLADNLREKDNHLKEKMRVFKEFVSEKTQELDGLKEAYLDLYSKQENLNEINDYLERENEVLKTEIEKIKPLEENFENLAHVFANQMQAINMLVHDIEGYAIEIPKKQKTLIEALNNYTQGWLSQVGKDDLAKEVQTKMGISDGIEKDIKELNKTRNRSHSFPEVGGR